MVPTLFIFLTSLHCLQAVKLSSEDFLALGKCPLTEVDTYIFHNRHVNQSQVNLPRLRDLKRLYPGDKFTVSPEKSCVDESPLCWKVVNKRACIGQDREVGNYNVWRM